MKLPNRNLLLTAAVLLACLGPVRAQSVSVTIDATDLPRKLITGTLEFSVDRSLVTDGELALWYPKWVPGSHGPGGPVQNVAGMKIEDQNGVALTWKRSPGEVYKVLVEIPDDTTSLQLQLRYIANQPSTGSAGHDVFGSSRLGFISAGTVFLYPEGWDIDKAVATLRLRLPEQWVPATALKTQESQGELIAFEEVSVRRFIDSPVMCGPFHALYELSERESIPPHRLHVFSEEESVIELPDEMVSKMKAMVTQSALLFGSHPFDEFDILLATSDILGRNGLEHSTSSFNILGQHSFQNPQSLKGWDRLLVPHEYIHAWCGKYRRPDGMARSDFHSRKGTELLWVYEGLTQYLGEVVEARCGLMSAEEFRHRMEVEIRAAMLQQGREWRSLADTGACSHILRAKSNFWQRLRRSQDYYMEGMLFWLEADALIRERTKGDKSLDDFCALFFKADDSTPHPNPFTRQTVVDCLNQVHPYDWDELITRRIELPTPNFDTGFVEKLGFDVSYTSEPPRIPASTFRRVSGIDTLDSLGAVFGSDGTIKDLLLGSPIHQAKLGPGAKVLGINGSKFSEYRLRQAIEDSPKHKEITFLVQADDLLDSYVVKYAGGARYMNLVRKPNTPDMLAEIVKSKK